MPRKKQIPGEFGPRLSAIRKARGLTQIKLAEKANTTQRAISYYENECGYPPAPAVITLAKALEVSTDELLGVQNLTIDTFEDPEEKRLWKKFRKLGDLPEKDQRAVLRLINSLTGAR